ncbi:MAG: hypothetical protein HQK65_18090 [Desulfamplus sp.]|nr:hypothetical protein [Desulfamplus sp.]
MEQRDALFVINQNIILSEIVELCRKEFIQSALLVTTHRIFPTEENSFIKIANNIKILAFSDLLSESDMCRCDEIATNRLLIEKNSCCNSNYNHQFMSTCINEKNRILYERLLSNYKFNKIFYIPGLGISESFWKKKGAVLHAPKQHLIITNNRKNNVLKILMPLFNRAKMAISFIKPKTKFLIQSEGKTFVFLSSINRLRIRPETSAHKIKKRYCRFDKENIYCMTMHGYDGILANKVGGVLVFVDGYLPSNYSRSYVDCYGSNDIFVVRTMFDDRWLTAHGKKTMKPPDFIEQEVFAPCMITSANHVLIALNHAGDWSALINRSDTDELVIAASEMARKLPKIEFRIRIHPTMNQPEHEGLYSSIRIEQFVRSVNIPNLDISTHSLPDDLEWADIFLSEYSQVLLDSLRNGKFGIAVNLTKRRSFMQDYADLGFFYANSINDAIDVIHYIVNMTYKSTTEQNIAVNNYNLLLRRWLELKNTSNDPIIL